MWAKVRSRLEARVGSTLRVVAVSSWELDESGRPRMSYTSGRPRDPRQQMLFAEDRERELFREIERELRECDIAALAPLAALNILARLVEKLRQ